MTTRSHQLGSALVVLLELRIVQQCEADQPDALGNVPERHCYACDNGCGDQIDAGAGEHAALYAAAPTIASLKLRTFASHLALMALMARGLSVDPRPNGTIGKPSLRNQKEVSIYLYFSGARASERGRAISAISAIRLERAALRLKNNQRGSNARAGAAAVSNKIMPYIRAPRSEFCEAPSELFQAPYPGLFQTVLDRPRSSRRSFNRAERVASRALTRRKIRDEQPETAHPCLPPRSLTAATYPAETPRPRANRRHPHV